MCAWRGPEAYAGADRRGGGSSGEARGRREPWLLVSAPQLRVPWTTNGSAGLRYVRRSFRTSAKEFM
jgi:hypothetical protein